ncbi:class II fructose-bisphosphate aldolase [Flavimaricola marinus]|uniref:Fructose-bisphosphate aldolase n=1 Tax=Flavimaricola marinus TaxID=1819565 RepID=A0A238LDC9_9RHOB|nr:class II fructose-bisphosphate aldolase [Flavimaricola marinus]SMY07621.1 Fructose-bisphosphate aldolase [Flavimaricola marinus]
MALATLSEVLIPARTQGYAVAGLVCLGWEDARAYAAAAEAENCPVILQVGPGARAHMPLPIWAKMLVYLAENTSVPVVVHLDHGRSLEECRVAVEEGFSSVMFDGSLKSLAENIEIMRIVAEMSHAAGVSCEGEIGVVGYASGAASMGTDPAEAARFAAETGVDAMAVSAGNTHLQTSSNAGLNIELLKKIRHSAPDTPLVIHGGSGVPEGERVELARAGMVSKFNIGTELRLAFGASLRRGLNKNPEAFDRIDILKSTAADIEAAARRVIRAIGPSETSG